MRAPSTVIDYRGTFEFPLPPAALWEALSSPERFESWWSWLHEFRLRGDGLVDGATLRGVVAPPVPYRMRIDVLLERCEPPSRIEAVVSGDLRGPATLELVQSTRGTAATVAWRIEMMQPAMRLAARFAHPMLRWGHDRVVEMTVAGFRRRLAETR
ncbi:MAG TPA: SRPBCC family protein [Acidimicrobiales bacterium]|nr:SRPBCC family protein [Acidimicrobiales bacterium]